jgi:hypothetical protein
MNKRVLAAHLPNGRYSGHIRLTQPNPFRDCRNSAIRCLMTTFRQCTALMLFVTGCLGASAFADSEAQELTVHEQRAIVAEFQELLEAEYVLEDNLSLFTDGFESAIEAGLYSQPQSTEDFSKRTNEIIQASFPDRHLAILSPDRYEQVVRMFGNPTAEQRDAKASQAGHAGHTQPATSADTREEREQAGLNALREVAGITRVSEINRDGLNQVGYVAFERLVYSEKAKSVIANIFATFSESERIIIDLRDCLGGDAEMVVFLSNYFFDERTHLVSSQTRGSERVERWTQPNDLSPIFAKMDLDVLISNQTFSAGESFAFGLKRTGRARLLGLATGGGGHMNDFFPLPSGFGASISVGRTFDPRTGEGWQGEGVTPHITFQKDHTLSETLKLITVASGKLKSFSAEELEVYQILQEYTHAWYNANVDEMKDVILDTFKAVSHSGNAVEKRDYQQQLIATEKGDGTMAQVYHNRIIRNINVSEGYATAELVLRRTSHSVRLQKSARGWRIVLDEYTDKFQHG